MLKGKSLLGYTNLFSQNDYEKNDKKLRNSLCKYKIYLQREFLNFLSFLR